LADEPCSFGRLRLGCGDGPVVIILSLVAEDFSEVRLDGEDGAGCLADDLLDDPAQQQPPQAGEAARVPHNQVTGIVPAKVDVSLGRMPLRQVALHAHARGNLKVQLRALHFEAPSSHQDVVTIPVS